MIGRASTMVSPSSSSATRSTPWVEGCCGPMLSVMVSVRTVPDLLRGELLQGRIGQLPARRVVGERHLLVAERRVLAQRPAHPVLGQQDAGQPGMPGELDAVEVVGLAFVPVGGGPHACDARHARVLLAHGDLERDPRRAREREQPVDHLEARIARQPVHARDPGQHGEFELGVIAQEGADLDEMLGRDVERVVADRISGLAPDRRPGETHAQPLLDALRGQRGHATALRLFFFFGGTGPSSTRDARIFSWSFMMPWINASGRGGQPGTYTSTGTILSTPWRIA